MTKPILKVSVRAFCLHADGYSNHGERIEGTHLVLQGQGVWVDGEKVIHRDRRMIASREAGHPWLTSDGTPWTGFDISVETGR